MSIRTRFAPSPTGYLHIGGVRTALFSWAFAKKHKGQFVLRIEDTDLERSTAASVQAILDGMHWVNMGYDEGPFYQTKRFDRYKEVIAKMLADGSAYYCYTTKEELDAQRAEAEANKQHFMYDGKWRPEAGKTLPAIPEGVPPVVRFKMPQDGVTAWDDAVKGRIDFNNKEFDDLIIARAGASTVTELAVAGRPAILIPLGIAMDDHQTANAEGMVTGAAADVVPEPKFTAEMLAPLLLERISNAGVLRARAKASWQLGKPNAARELADLAEQAAGMK